MKSELQQLNNEKKLYPPETKIAKELLKKMLVIGKRKRLRMQRLADIQLQLGQLD